MKKIIINNCYGGFSLSYEAIMAYAERKGIKLYAYVAEDYLTNKYKEYIVGYSAFCVHYSTNPLNKDGIISESGYFSNRNIPRDDLDLIAVVEELGEKANGDHAELKIVEIPDDVDWIIEEYDGNEWVAEKHRIWN